MPGTLPCVTLECVAHLPMHHDGVTVAPLGEQLVHLPNQGQHLEGQVEDGLLLQETETKEGVS